MIWGLYLAVSYLLGSISWSYLIVRSAQNLDVRNVGSGNAGATNVLRVAGVLPALLALALDVGKGLAVVLVAEKLEAPGPIVGSAAMAAILGHIYPIFHGFRGGKGVATAAGALVGLAPLAASLSVLAFLLVVLITRYVSLGSMASAVLFAPIAWLCARLGWSDKAPGWLLISSAAIAALIVYKHQDNIRRLRAGQELKLDQLRRSEEAL